MDGAAVPGRGPRAAQQLGAAQAHIQLLQQREMAMAFQRAGPPGTHREAEGRRVGVEGWAGPPPLVTAHDTPRTHSALSTAGGPVLNRPTAPATLP